MRRLRRRKKQWLKFVICGIVFLTLLLLTNCTTVLNGDFCDIYQPVYLDFDKDTPETVNQVDYNNIVYWSYCDGKR